MRTRIMFGAAAVIVVCVALAAGSAWHIQVQSTPTVVTAQTSTANSCDELFNNYNQPKASGAAGVIYMFTQLPASQFFNALNYENAWDRRVLYYGEITTPTWGFSGPIQALWFFDNGAAIVYQC